MSEVKESDWRLFRKKLPVWQEAYMERLIEQYQAFLAGDDPASKKFWDLRKRIMKDARRTGVVAEIRRSMMKFELIELYQEGAIKREDLDDFSQELQDELDEDLGITER